MVRRSWRRSALRRPAYRPRRRRQFGISALLALLVIAGAVVAVGMLSRRAGGEQAEALAAYVRANAVEPSALIARLGASRRLLFLSDIAGAVAPKRMAVEAIAALAQGPGLDVVVLEVPVDLQSVIERYLNTEPEDAAMLLAAPGLLRQHAGASQAYLEIYRTVWRENQRVGAHRRIRILAADRADWPPAGALSPRAAAELFAQRDSAMAERLEQAVLDVAPRSRALLFLSGFHALRGGHGELRAGGGEPIRVRWLASRLAATYPAEVATILIDVGAAPTTGGAVADYVGTRAYELLHSHLGGVPPRAVRVGSAFDFMREPIITRASAGLDFELAPGNLRLGDVADGYIYHAGG
ncbi:MAG: hypothetical protein ACRELD_11135 [Longimicrobiales bacterium]